MKFFAIVKTGKSTGMGNKASKSIFLVFLILSLLATTTCNKLEKLMMVTTGGVSDILVSSAKDSGTIVDMGRGATKRGHCYSITPGATTAGLKAEGIPADTGSFISQLTDLAAGTKYYIKAFITNGTETVYGKEISFTTLPLSSLKIGDRYQGGKVAYILQSGDQGYITGEIHGLIAAPTDQSTGIQWYNGSYTTTNSTETKLGAGNSNTNTIVSSQGAGSYAAKLCYDLVLESYSDWYLPSRDELNQLYINRTAIGGFTTTLANYWSSSENNNTDALLLNFSDGSSGNAAKNSLCYVRAVRSF
jgi:hypothetical protein